MMQSEPPEDSGFQNLTDATRKYQRIGQAYLDRITPYTLYRWTGTWVLLLLFMTRVLLAQGWYIVCYALGIYLLNLFLAFLQPKFDPSLEMDIAESELEDGAPTLPTSSSQIDKDDEFRPFMRRLPEFKFWFSATRAVLISIVASFFEMFNLPVFWPILLVYFCVLFAITMRRQIAHMRKYR
ncbi:retrieval of early ER protein Rer1 [Atractiella rhizophila]|nr:retrieval of early ER protein Rer1 [Atractiella rhizophila]